MMTPDTQPLMLRIERTFNARSERVFAAWTQPDLMRQWSAPADLFVAEGEGDVVQGGKWRVVMVERAGGRRHVAVGRYLEVEPPARLRFSHAWQGAGESFDDAMTHHTVVTVELQDLGSTTHMIFTQQGFESAASRDGHEEGWNSSFDLLTQLLDNKEHVA